MHDHKQATDTAKRKASPKSRGAKPRPYCPAIWTGDVERLPDNWRSLHPAVFARPQLTYQRDRSAEVCLYGLVGPAEWGALTRALDQAKSAKAKRFVLRVSSLAQSLVGAGEAIQCVGYFGNELPVTVVLEGRDPAGALYLLSTFASDIVLADADCDFPSTPLSFQTVDLGDRGRQNESTSLMVEIMENLANRAHYGINPRDTLWDAVRGYLRRAFSVSEVKEFERVVFRKGY